MDSTVLERIQELASSQPEGWHAEVEKLQPGVLVGLSPGRSWCKICGAPTTEVF